MAERACRDGSTSSRRQSFRRSLAEAGLPEDALDRLEAKRKQLDDSIHKYIAQKEREYKSFEKDEIQRHKLSQGSSGANARRTSSESTQDTVASPQLRGQQQDVVDALHSIGLRREHIGQPHSIAVVGEDGTAPTLEARPSLAGLTDRRASIEREKEFIGVFTPTYLPALENGDKRADSAPPVVSTTGQADGAGSQDMQRANSDPVGQAQQRRPIQLQLASRTSSSGSSADGNGQNKLTSALKSPTHPRPKRKRVSLAVGNTIVAPSDNVPITLESNNSTPSHSRTRSPASDRDTSPKQANGKPTTTSPKDSPQQQASTTTTADISPLDSTPKLSALPRSTPNGKGKQPATSMPPPNTFDAISSKKAPPGVDGDLDFTLDDEDMISNGNEPSRFYQDSEEEIIGRVRSNNDDEAYESSESPMHQLDHDTEHIEFHPGSVQRTNSPGFRRPSVSVDPIYRGSNYDVAEHNAAVNEIYGSTSRPQASFSGGSLGESFMATNAARMMRDRKASEQTQVRS